MGRLKTYLWRYWRRYLLGGLCLLGTATLVMWIPWWIREAVRILEEGGAFGRGGAGDHTNLLPSIDL
jgi:ABC-type multidrug transport system fused ATPase/permease subunit